ncbi:hypothetical protein ACIRD3_14625 [Kitasatospora sp. NPDC093550]|uniref:hypothetical protein n=1 Tax=Kitasatospora sp. NPDC093550 TaxID=3364089 RepID=UPI00380440C5
MNEPSTNRPSEDGPTTADRQLAAAFDLAMEGVGPALGPLVTGAAARGRSIRRRRRLTATGAAAAAVVLVAGGALALRPGGSATATPALGTTSTASPTAGRTFPQPLQKSDDGPEKLTPGTGAHQGAVALTGHATVLTLAQALPPAHTSNYAGYADLVGWTGPDMTNVIARGSLLYDDGTGPAQVLVEVDGGIGALYRPGSYPPGPGRDPFVIGYDDDYGCATTTGPNIRACSAAVLPDGSHLKLTESAVGDTLTRTANLLRPDHTRVTVTALNTAEVAGAAKGGTIRDGLPLTLDQLKAAAMATGFHEWITPEEAQRAEEAVRPFHDDSPGRDHPSGGPSASAAASAG